MVWHMQYSLRDDTKVAVKIAETAHTTLKAELRKFAGSSEIDYWRFYLKWVAGSPGPTEMMGVVSVV